MGKILRALLPLFFFVSFLSLAKAQDSVHVRWTVVPEKSGGNEVVFRFSGKISKGWHVYAIPDEAQGTLGPLSPFPTPPSLQVL